MLEFPVDYFRDEVREGFLVDSTMKTVWAAELEVLNEIAAICARHGLKWYAAYGTLLGVVRHQGFIPWDDDIDIFLPWRDYLKFIELFEETEQYSMMGFGTSQINDFIDVFAKVVDKRTIVNEDISTLRKVNPLWIDIFPLIGLPADKEERHLFFMNYKELTRQIWQEFYATNGSIEIFSKWFERQKAFLAKYDFDKSSYVGVLGTVYGEKDCTPRSVYDMTLQMKFEDIEVNVPGGYKEYLDNLYGTDWIKLPDKSKRKTHHNILAYWNR